MNYVIRRIISNQFRLRFFFLHKVGRSPPNIRIKWIAIIFFNNWATRFRNRKIRLHTLMLSRKFPRTISINLFFRDITEFRVQAVFLILINTYSTPLRIIQNTRIIRIILLLTILKRATIVLFKILDLILQIIPYLGPHLSLPLLFDFKIKYNFIFFTFSL